MVGTAVDAEREALERRKAELDEKEAELGNIVIALVAARSAASIPAAATLVGTPSEAPQMASGAPPEEPH